jgi:hypothetical protein
MFNSRDIVKSIVQLINKTLLILFHVCIRLSNETNPKSLALPVHKILISKRAKIAKKTKMWHNDSVRKHRLIHVCQPSTGQNLMNLLNYLTKYITWDRSQPSVASDKRELRVSFKPLLGFYNVKSFCVWHVIKLSWPGAFLFTEHVLFYLDIDECASSPCKNGGTCTNNQNQFTCACMAGWTGEDCDTGNMFSYYYPPPKRRRGI